MRKKILILSFILILVATAVIVYINMSNRSVILEELPDIEYDIIIDVKENTNHMPGGYASYNYYTLINIKEKMVYYICHTHNYGTSNGGSRSYYILEKKKLNDKQIEGLIRIVTSYEEFNGSSVDITYNGTTNSFKEETIQKALEEIGLKVKID